MVPHVFFLSNKVGLSGPVSSLLAACSCPGASVSFTTKQHCGHSVRCTWKLITLKSNLYLFFCLAIFKLTCFLCPQMDGERDGAIHKQRDCGGQGMLKCMLPMKEMFFKCQPVPCWKRVSETPATATLICFIFLTLGDPK